METEQGRTLVEYIVKCALPADRSIFKHYMEGEQSVEREFFGMLGVAPEWEASRCDIDCQERMTGCLLAHINTADVHEPIYLVGTNEAFPYIGPSLDLVGFPRQEAAFYGNVFLSPPEAYQCDGAEILPNPIPGRAGSEEPKEYANRGPCSSDCSVSYGAHGPEQTADGFATCNGRGNVLTVYTRFYAPPEPPPEP